MTTKILVDFQICVSVPLRFSAKIFITLDIMCISLSGGILMAPQKHREASKFIDNSGFYISTNVYPILVKDWTVKR